MHSENIDEFYHELLDVFRKFRAHIYNTFDFCCHGERHGHRTDSDEPVL